MGTGPGTARLAGDQGNRAREMAMHPSTRKWVFALAALGLLCAASSRVAPLDVQRESHKLVLPPLPEGIAQPSMLLRPLLAVGRAPVVAYLWMRASKLKEEKLYFDAYQLSQMICELQPRFASVWSFQAWNMAYNISVTLKSPEERWRWVRNGYELLRDQGIPMNPTNTQLYKELSWMLYHKVADIMDNEHWYYKLQFALQMEDILGRPPEDYVRPGRVRGDFYRNYNYQVLAVAPQNVEELLAVPDVERLSETIAGLEASQAQRQEEDPQVREAIEALEWLRDAGEQGVSPVRGFVERLREFGFDAAEEGVYLGLLASLRDGAVQLVGVEPGHYETRLHELKALMSDKATQNARLAIERYWRADRLRHEVKLDPERLVRLHEAFGMIFDYRLAEAHAVYWTSLGIEKGVDRQRAIDVHRLNTQRIVAYAVQRMFHRGRLAMSRNSEMGEPPLLSPDVRAIPVLFDTFIERSKEYLPFEKQQTPVSTNFITGFIGFVRRAILRYHEAGMQDEAQELFDFLRENYPDPMYLAGLDGFLVAQFLYDRDTDDMPRTLARIDALVGRALRLYAYDEDDDAVRCLARGKQIYDYYQANIISDRLEIPLTYGEIVERLTHRFGGTMYRETYERVCAKLGVEPLPVKGETTGSPGE